MPSENQYQLGGRSHEQSEQRRTRSIVRGGRRGVSQRRHWACHVVHFWSPYKYTNLGETTALEDGELLKPFAGERCGTA